MTWKIDTPRVRKSDSQVSLFQDFAEARRQVVIDIVTDAQDALVEGDGAAGALLELAREALEWAEPDPSASLAAEPLATGVSTHYSIRQARR